LIFEYDEESTLAELSPGRAPRPPTILYGRNSIQIVVDHARWGHFYLLVLWHDARRTLLQRLRKGAAAGAGRLFHFFRPASQVGNQYRTARKRQSSLLNDAYRTLKDPIRRTEYLLRLEGVELEEQSKAATEKARSTGETKKQVVPPDLLEEVFELNMQLEELRAQKKLGEDDPALLEELGKAKLSLEEKSENLMSELQTYWKDWDREVDSGTDESRRKTRDKMVDMINRRNYIRNLVRDVNEALEN
jgi:molecular chaperone HscB